MKKNTLFISFDGLSDPLGQSQILPYLIGISQQGYHITILSCEKESRLNKEKYTIEEKIKKYNLSWQYISYAEDGNFLHRIQYVIKLYFLAKTLCKQKSTRLIHCRSYLTALIGLRLKHRLNIPFIFDMRGFWADERIDGGIWNLNNNLHRLFYQYFKKKEKQFLKEANAVVSLTQAGLTELNAKFPELHLSAKTSIIPCCTNTELFKRNTINDKVQLKEISNNDHVIIYTGSIGTWYYTKEMIDCILIWKTFIPNLKFLILTKDQTELSFILKQYSPSDQAFIVSASAGYNQVVNYLSLAKAALFFIKPAYSKIASSPTKMAECWALDLPIITNSGIGDNDLYFNTHNGGILLNEFNAKAYEEACKNYLKLKPELNHYRQIALNYFDNSLAIKKYSAIYSELCK